MAEPSIKFVKIYHKIFTMVWTVACIILSLAGLAFLIGMIVTGGSEGEGNDKGLSVMFYIIPVVMFFWGIGMLVIGRMMLKRFGERLVLQAQMQAESQSEKND
ncbi:MAG: hypothetical protein ACYS47_02745 [Planctomycetota bacterium]|jgi:4-hydroxybenzoate polyprenyltransferase